MRRWHFALAITTSAAALACATWLLAPVGTPKAERLTLPATLSRATEAPLAAAPEAEPASLQPAIPSSAPTQVVAFDTTNLFSVFQLAIGSSDPKTIERGLSAWRTCAGYVGLGSWDLETWLNEVLPEGLAPADRERRAKRGRASAARCAGFAGQLEAAEQADALSKHARELGLVSEQLRSAVFDSPWSAENQDTFARLSCAVVSQYPDNKHGIRLISIAMRSAAASRSSHLLNAVSPRARSVAINLAFCDLDPEGCNSHSNFVGSACMQSGACSYAREEDYWLATTPPEVLAEAQPLRTALVRLVNQRACNELFR